MAACHRKGERMTIANGTNVSLEYTLKLEDQTVVDTNVGAAPLTYTHGSNDIIPGLEKALSGMKVGESTQVVVPAEEAYGGVDPGAIQEVPKEKLPPDALHVGAQVHGKDDSGGPLQALVTEVKDQTVVLDFNHPLAGKTLYFDVKVLDIQQPSTP